MLTNQHINTIKSTIPLLEAGGTALTAHFYQRMFKHNPELMHIFNMSNQKSGRQQAALFEAIAAYAKNIENLEVLTTAVERIAHKHTSLAIKAEHYAIVGHHLIETLRELLPEQFSKDVEEAWTSAYTFLANIFINREQQLYQQSSTSKGGWADTRSFIVQDKVVESALVTSFVLVPQDGEAVISYREGQYIGIEVQPDDSEYREIRQYSLSNASNNQGYRISVKREVAEHVGKVSNYLHDKVAINDVVQLHAPAGDFFFVDRQKEVALISAGVGITPMQAMLERLNADQYGQKVTFIHACLDQSEHSFSERTQVLCENNGWQQHSWYERGELALQNGHRGYIDVSELTLNIANTDFYLCGPIVFMSFINQQLLALGANSENIYYEVFGPHQGF